METERKSINCYSRSAKWLEYISYSVLILGAISYLGVVYLDCLTIKDSLLSGATSVFEFSALPAALIASLPVLIYCSFCFGIGLCVSSITQNIEQQSTYIHFKAKEEGVDLDYSEQ